MLFIQEQRNTLNDLWRDPIWTSIGVFVAAVFSLIAIMVTVRTARRPKKSLSYEILSTSSLLESSKLIKGRLKILFDEREVQNVHYVLVRLTNTGEIPILASEFEGEVRIQINSTGADATIKLLDASISAAEPKELNGSVTVKDGAILLKPLLLNQADSITIRM